VIAFMSRSPWPIAGAIVLGSLGILLSISRPLRPGVELPPAPRSGFRAWIREGAWVRLKSLLQRAPYGAVPAKVLLGLGLVPLALGVIEAFTPLLWVGPYSQLSCRATGDGEADVGPADVMTCANASDGPFIPDDKHSAWQILAPIFGLYHVRSGNATALHRQAHKTSCDVRASY